MTELRDLLEALRQGKHPPLSVDEVELLLAWLTGSAAREGADAVDLPDPGHDPVLLHMVLHRLDDVLFDGGELRLVAAGLDNPEPATRRRIRFRRLAGAFHPDRFPELSDWLTRRSQAVHRAYAHFKQDSQAPAAAQPEQPAHARPYSPSPRPGRPNMQRPRVKHRFGRFANRLRARFGNDRYLAHKLIGGLALLALLPVLNMVLAPGPGNGVVDGSRDRSAQNAPPTTRQPADRPAGEAAAGVAPGPAGEDREPAARTASATIETAAPVAGSETTLETRLETKPGKDHPESSSAPDDPEIPPLLAAARRAMNPNGGITPVAALPSVEAQLAAMGLESDTERLYRRIGAQAEKPLPGRRLSVSDEKNRTATADVGGAGSARAGERPETDPVLAQAPARVDRHMDRKTSSIGSHYDDGDESGSGLAAATGTQTDPGGEASELVLGPLDRHPAGEALKTLHQALAAGSIPGIVGAFAPNARMDSLHGREAIATHFRTVLDSADSRRVKLKVLRLRRENGGWHVEADLDLRVRRDGSNYTLLTGRNNFWLIERGSRLLIARMERE